MKYAFYTRKNRDDADKLKEIIKNNISINFIEDENNPDVVICIGGDGTFLEAVSKYIDIIDKVAFVPFMTGHLGFYIDFLPEDAKDINDILINKPHIQNLPLIEADIDNNVYYAVNEFSLGQFAHASAYDIRINDELLESYYGSGLLISTTYGSSAYNRSVGGPIVDNKLNAIILSKIAPITSRQYTSIAAPIVFNDDKVITLEYKVRHRTKYPQVLTADNRVYQFNELSTIIIKKSQKTVKLYTKDNYDYLKRVRKAC
ncbi:MAG: hypothetical protein E7178_00540 [Erysipelotrichaceae bacterium]|nr:hypothetical protein [Erysipelotrichaceae bacterium]